MKGLIGRLRWKGPDPDVIQLVDNNVRKVMFRVAHNELEIEVVLGDVDQFIRDLEYARVWTREG